jgi:hypothetical protein
MQWCFVSTFVKPMNRPVIVRASWCLQVMQVFIHRTQDTDRNPDNPRRLTTAAELHLH